MSEKLKQSLSAVMDDEADEFETRRVLDEIQRDDALREMWERYHMVSSVMRGETLAPKAAKARFWAALDGDEAPAVEEVVVDRAPLPQSRKHLGRVAGVAVAATVAAVVIITFGLPQETSRAPELAAVPPVAVTAPGREALATIVSARDWRRTNAYMLQHAQSTSMVNRASAAIPAFVKFAAYESVDE